MVDQPARKNFAPYLLLLVVPFVAYWQIGMLQHTMKWDMLDQFFPYRYFLSECFDARVLPSWNPYQHLGAPFHADPQSGFWYPLAWLFAVLRGYDIYTMNFEFVLHICIAGIGFFKLLRGFRIEDKPALLFSIAWQCCGLFVNNAQHLTWIVALAWLPFVIHYYFSMLETRRARHAIATGFYLMLMLTGGYPIFTVITVYFFAIVFLVQVIRALQQENAQQIRILIILNILVFGVFALLASGYLISFSQTFPFISRGAGLTMDRAMEGALPLKALISFLVPFATSKNEGVFITDLSMLSVYIGLVPLLFAAISFFYFPDSRVRLFLLFGVVCFLAALGDATPVRGLLYQWLPAMDKFRFPAIFRAFFMFSMLVAGAIAFQKSIYHWSVLKKYFVFLTVLLALAMIIAHVLVLEKANYFVKFPSLFNVEHYLSYFERANLQQRIAIQSLVQLGWLVALGLSFIFVKQPQRLVRTLLCITLAELFFAVQFNLPATAISDAKTSTFQKGLDEMPRGFPIPEMKSINEVVTQDTRLYPGWYNQNIFLKQPSAAGFNSFQLTDYANFYDSPSSDSFLKHPLIFLEPADSNQSVRFTKFAPNAMEVQVSSTTAATLTLLQSVHPGWKASIDSSTPVNFEKNEFPFLSVPVPAGMHLVKFEYAPPYLIPTLWVAALFFCVVLWYLVVSRFRRQAF